MRQARRPAFGIPNLEAQEMIILNRRTVAVSSVVALALLAAPTFAQHPDADSPRFKAFRTLERLIQSHGDAPLRKFLDDKVAAELKERHSDEELLRMLRQVRSDFSNTSMQSASPLGPMSIQMIFRSQGPGSRTSLALRLDPKPPHGFIDFGYKAPRDPSLGEAPVGFPGELREFMEDLVSRDEFSGTVLVAKDGKPVFEQAYGLASKRYNVSNRIDTKLNLGSMNKMFTGVAICQLVEQGRLSFDDKVIKYLPNYPNREVAEKVTIHQLLTHTSGLGSYFNDKYDTVWSTIRTLDQLLSVFVDEPLEFEPGARFGYSNSGPVVLGLIIERITGQTYYDYVRDHIYKPAGMIDTDCYAMDTPTPNLAIGYTHMDGNHEHRDGPRRNNLFSHSLKGGPAGGGFSTVEDLLRFSLALQEHKLLSPEMTETLLTRKIALGPGLGYAYFFGDETTNGHRHVGHNGGAPGISADFHIYSDLGYTVAVLSNYDGAAAIVSRFIRGIIERAPARQRREGGPSVERQMKSTGAPYRIGVMLRHAPDGMLVDGLVPGAPGEKAGLHAGDRILSINGQKLDPDAESVIAEVFSSPDVATLEVRRGDKTFTVKLKPELVAPEE